MRERRSRGRKRIRIIAKWGRGEVDGGGREGQQAAGRDIEGVARGRGQIRGTIMKSAALEYNPRLRGLANLAAVWHAEFLRDSLRCIALCVFGVDGLVRVRGRVCVCANVEMGGIWPDGWLGMFVPRRLCVCVCPLSTVLLKIYTLSLSVLVLVLV